VRYVRGKGTRSEREMRGYGESSGTNRKSIKKECVLISHAYLFFLCQSLSLLSMGLTGKKVFRTTIIGID
jgi:hypothetical protein